MRMPYPPRYLLYRALGALVPYMSGMFSDSMIDTSGLLVSWDVAGLGSSSLSRPRAQGLKSNLEL